MKRNMQILMTIDSLDPAQGGPARSVYKLANVLKADDSLIDLFTNDKENPLNTFNKNHINSVSVHNIDQFPSFLKKYSKGTNNHPLLIHNHGIWLPINHTASVSARHNNIPLIISPRGMLEPWALNYRRWKKKLAWLLYQRRDLQAASVLHATSEKEAENLQTLGFQIPIAVIPNGVEIPSTETRTEKSQTKKTVLFLGRIHPVKGLLNLIQAWAIVNPSDWRVIIAGPDEGGHKAEVEWEISKNKLEDSFTFIGPVTDRDKWKLYQQADLFILPTHTENFGIVIAEALASGIPVITTKGAPWKELEIHRCGWWADIGVDPLQKVISEAISLTVEERQNMGKRGQNLVEQNYSWGQISESMSSVYAWMLDTSTPHPDCMIIDK